GEMRRAVINAFTEASSGEMAKALCELLVRMKDITREERAALWQACSANPQVADADGVCASIYAHFGMPQTPQPSAVPEDIPF
ncbi:MAG: hypothetical protein L0Y70_15595, partial [Gemmataceae bacterium]|nr:hypothetical protein [Gemmataceae bacterium]